MARPTYVGSHPSHQGVVERIDSTKQLTRSDSGKLFMCHSASSDYAINLPQLSVEIAGWNATFILKGVSGAQDVQILAYGVAVDGGTGTDSNTGIALNIYTGSESVSGATTIAQNTSGTADGMKFLAGGSQEKGSKIEVKTDGTRWWYLGKSLGSNSTIEVLTA